MTRPQASPRGGFRLLLGAPPAGSIAFHEHCAVDPRELVDLLGAASQPDSWLDPCLPGSLPAG
eukprot:14298194-Alexandrium_andersonii.AAC.1